MYSVSQRLIHNGHVFRITLITNESLSPDGEGNCTRNFILVLSVCTSSIQEIGVESEQFARFAFIVNER